MAFGRDRYVRMARCLGKSIRMVNENVKTAIVTDRTERDFESYDYKVKLDKSKGKGVTQKLYLNHYSPFGETLFIDSDCIVYKNIDMIWEEYRKYGDFVVEIEGYAEKSDEYQWSKNMKKTLEGAGIERIPLYNGGVYYFKKSSKTEKVFSVARDFYERREELGIKPFRDSPVNEETVIGMSIEKNKIEMPNFSGKIMGKSEYANEYITHADVLSGECEYIREGKKHNPILLHYNISRKNSYGYLRQVYLLEGGKGGLQRLTSYFKAYLESKYYDIKSRIERAKERRKSIGFIGILPARILEGLGLMEE